MATTRRHMCMSVEGAIRNKFFTGFIDGNGRKLSRKEGKAYLEQCRMEGKRVIPMSKECEGFDYQKGCPGHPIPDEIKIDPPRYDPGEYDFPRTVE